MFSLPCILTFVQTLTETYVNSWLIDVSFTRNHIHVLLPFACFTSERVSTCTKIHLSTTRINLGSTHSGLVTSAIDLWWLTLLQSPCWICSFFSLKNIWWGICFHGWSSGSSSSIIVFDSCYVGSEVLCYYWCLLTLCLAVVDQGSILDLNLSNKVW